jgi:hypothetical protein
MIIFKDKNCVLSLEIFVADIKPNQKLKAGTSKLFHEIFVADIKPNQKLKAGTLKLFNEISQVKSQGRKGNHKFPLLHASCAIKLQSCLPCS